MKVPVLLLFFNRKDTLSAVIARLKDYQPDKIYLASDGARPHTHDEAELIIQIRQFVLDSIVWDCEVKTLFRDENLGCKYAVHGAVQWFFSQEEQGIVLEDDIVPSDNFFIFCEEMLEKYKYDKRVGSITGRNDLGSFDSHASQYYFSNKFFCWGWASWADRVVDNNVEIGVTSVIDKKIFSNLYYKEKMLVKGMLGLMKSKQVNSWAYPYDLSFRVKHQLCLVPSKNMVKNIGLDVVGAHSTGKRSDELKRYDEYLPRFNESRLVQANELFLKKLIESKYSNLFLLLFSKAQYLKIPRMIVNNIRKYLFRRL